MYASVSTLDWTQAYTYGFDVQERKYGLVYASLYTVVHVTVPLLSGIYFLLLYLYINKGRH